MSGGFGRTPPETIGDSKTEFSRILCTSKSEAAVTSNKNCAVGMLKLTTDKHEASRGLSATAELLVPFDCFVYRPNVTCLKRFNTTGITQVRWTTLSAKLAIVS